MIQQFFSFCFWMCGLSGNNFKGDKKGKFVWKFLSVSIMGHTSDKPQDLLPIQKFVRRSERSKRKTVHGRMFNKAANLGPSLDLKVR